MKYSHESIVLSEIAMGCLATVVDAGYFELVSMPDCSLHSVLRGGERAWYTCTLNAHAPVFSVKFAIKPTGYVCQHMVEYTEKLGRLRIDLCHR